MNIIDLKVLSQDGFKSNVQFKVKIRGLVVDGPTLISRTADGRPGIILSY